MGIITITKIFKVIFIPLFMSQLSIKHSTTLVRWNTPSNFYLTLPGGITNSSTSFRVVAIVPVGHFITTLPLDENLEKYPPLLLIPPPTSKHKRVCKEVSLKKIIKNNADLNGLTKPQKNLNILHEILESNNLRVEIRIWGWENEGT